MIETLKANNHTSTSSTKIPFSSFAKVTFVIILLSHVLMKLLSEIIKLVDRL